MDPIDNPYTPNAGSRPPELTGRNHELEAFRVLVGRLKQGRTDQSMIIRGLRGVGKTVLLNAFEDQAEAAGFLTYFHEMTPETSLVEVLARDAQMAMRRLKLTEKALAAVRGALSGLSTIKVGGLGFDLEVHTKSASESTLTEDLTQLLLQLGQATREKDAGVVFLLDEVQFVKEVEYRALISALHRTTQKGLPLTLAAAGLPQIPRLTGDARSYAERLFSFPVIGNLDPDAALAALAEPARREGASFTPEAMERALEWTAGYPFYIQQIGKHAWNIANASPITLADIEAAVPTAQEALDVSIYEVRVQRATDQERMYLRAMAELGGGPYRSGAVAKKLGKRTTDTSQVRQRLMEKGLVYATEDYGFVDFTVPRFDEFMRRHMTFAPARRKASPGQSMDEPGGLD